MLAILHQFLLLPVTLLRIARIVRRECSPAALDEYLFSFHGFHHEPEDRHWYMRTWDRVPVRDIAPDQVVAVPMRHLAAMLRVAIEIEAPIRTYSLESGEGFRLLLPTLSRFMGMTRQRAAAVVAAAAKGREVWCESPWCMEESRHGAMFARILSRLTGESVASETTDRAIPAAGGDDEAFAHLVAREATEWNAASVYVVMAAHTRGPLRAAVENIMRDELKHCMVLSAAHTVLDGRRYWRRLWLMLVKSIGSLRHHRSVRADGAVFVTTPCSFLEAAFAHALTEFHIRRHVERTPMSVLREMFEPASPRQGSACGERSVARGRRPAVGRPLGAASMLGASQRARRRELLAAEFECRHRLALDGFVREELDGFRGAEDLGSRRSRAVLGVIGRCSDWRLRDALTARLRRYQLVNNRHSRGRSVRSGRPSDACRRSPAEELTQR
ncbi:MAG: ferritin-like domain-containing protein [Planctomycetes bacterium]|nr:ferritin-like domain-containing protein [Planctomycetota bacterium]